MTAFNMTTYWQQPPPEPSPGLCKWLAKIQAGWQPNRRISSLGYSVAAKFYQVSIWEHLEVLAPLLGKRPLKPEVRQWLTNRDLRP